MAGAIGITTKLNQIPRKYKNRGYYFKQCPGDDRRLWINFCLKYQAKNLRKLKHAERAGKFKSKD
jgi:hypothetical protein